jgi:hypothetical protein
MSGNPLGLSAYAQCRAAVKARKKRGRGKRSDGVAAKRRRKRFRVREAAASVPLLPGGLNSATTNAICPGRTKAVSGGFSLHPAPFAGGGPIDFALSFENRRTFAKGWTASATQLSPSQRTLTTYAYCVPGKTPKERSLTAFLSGTPLSTAAVNTLPCPSRLRLAGGGFVAPVPSPDGGTGTFLTSAPSGKGWRLLALQGGDGTGGPVSGYGYCL